MLGQIICIIIIGIQNEKTVKRYKFMYSMISTTVSKNGGTTASPFTSTDYISASIKSRNRYCINIYEGANNKY